MISWTTEMDEKLRRLRREKLSYTSIGARMGMTKTQVVGRAQRIGMGDPAASPIKRRPVVAPPAPVPNDPGCRWPLWAHNDTPDQRFCSARRAGPLPYCIEHAKKSYVTARPAASSTRTIDHIRGARR